MLILATVDLPMKLITMSWLNATQAMLTIMTYLH